MYEAVPGPYSYPDTAVLRNLPGHTAQADLDRFEAVATARRFLEPMPDGRWSVRHYLAVHHHIFQDAYPWAGRLRSIRIAKGTSMFCYPENIAAELRRLFGELRGAGFVRDLEPGAFADPAATDFPLYGRNGAWVNAQ